MYDSHKFAASASVITAIINIKSTRCSILLRLTELLLVVGAASLIQKPIVA